MAIGLQNFGSLYGTIISHNTKNYTVQVELETGDIRDDVPIMSTIIGEYQMPAVGTLVKVDLILNDLNRPIVTGVIYNKSNPTNQPNAKNKVHSKNANIKWKIYRHYDTGMEMHIKENGEYVVFTPEKIIIQADKNIEIRSSAKVIVTAPNVEINSENIDLGNAVLDALVKSAWVQSVFPAHVHIGNLGAPTGPPIELVPTVPNLHFTQQVTGA